MRLFEFLKKHNAKLEYVPGHECFMLSAPNPKGGPGYYATFRFTDDGDYSDAQILNEFVAPIILSIQRALEN